MADNVQAAVLFAEDDCLKPSKVELTNEQTGDTFSVDTSGKLARFSKFHQNYLTQMSSIRLCLSKNNLKFPMKHTMK